MIFFVIKNAALTATNFTSITTPVRSSMNWDAAGVNLIAWNEVPAYSTPDTFRAALLAEAKNDPVCQAMCVVSKSAYGMNPLDPHDADTLKVLDKVLKQWLSPLTGNLVNWPKVRPITKETQTLTNWEPIQELGPDTANSMDALTPHEFFDLDVTGRKDQAKVFYNITEAARAVLGEVTSEPSRKLEKIFTLRLVLSPKLLAAQRAILASFWASCEAEFYTKAKEKKAYEYLVYYVKGFNTLGEAALVQTIRALFAHSSGVAYAPTLEQTAQVSQTALTEWKKLPPVIACAILLSDIARIMGPQLYGDRPRVCFDLTEWKPQFAYNPASAPTSLPTDPLHSQSMWLLNWKFTYRIVRDKNFNKHATDFITASVSGRTVKPKLFGWNRNEYAPEVITQRVHLCPIWGGSSGHATGRIVWWLKYKKDKNVLKTVPVRLTIAASYAALWRLYYDKRVSPVHTLLETLEGTFTHLAQVPGSVVDTLPSIGDSRSRDTYHDDAFDLLIDCARSGRDATKNAGGDEVERAVNPLTVWSSIKVEHTNGVRTHKELTKSLKAQIDLLRKQVIEKQAEWLPRWSKEKTLKQATEVTSFQAG